MKRINKPLAPALGGIVLAIDGSSEDTQVCLSVLNRVNLSRGQHEVFICRPTR